MGQEIRIAGGLRKSILAKHPAEMPELKYQVFLRKTRAVFWIFSLLNHESCKVKGFFYSKTNENQVSMRHSQNRPLEN